MIDLRFRPLTRWIGQKRATHNRKRASFSTPYVKLLDRLEYELKNLKALNVVVEAGFREDQIRNDGWPYGSASPREPGVILSFDSKYGPLSLPCDYFTEWQKNLHAITLHLEHLRLATAYGVGEHGEQYRGWKALPPPGGEHSLQELAERLISFSEMGAVYTAERLLNDPDAFDKVYRAAARNTHVDRAVHIAGWRPESWGEVQEARRIIAQFFEGRRNG
jgi:hypothetical protein